MKKVLILIAFFLPLTGFSQQVKVVTYDQLESVMTAEKEKLLVVNFWATWCGPCVKELPSFNRLSQDYAGKNVRVLLVSIDYKSKLEKTLKPFLKKNGIKPETVLLDETSGKWIDRVNPEWQGNIPVTLIIDGKTGKRSFFAKEFTYEELENTVKSLLTK